MMPESDKALVAACGLCCGHCPDYLAHAKGDREALKQAMEDIGKVLGRPVSPEEVKCLGCRGPIHTHYSASTDCDVRQCAGQKGILSCALCDEFSCEKLNRRNDKNATRNLRRIREVGLNPWLEEMKRS